MSNAGAAPTGSRELLHDLERGALPVTRSGTGQQCADRLNGLAVAANDTPDVRLAQLHSEDRCLSRRNFGEHHLIRKLNELANNELEKLFHGSKTIRPCAQAASSGTKERRSSDRRREDGRFGKRPSLSK